MKLIVAGGRDYKPTLPDQEALKDLIEMYDVQTIVSGGANGADRFGESVAEELGLNIHRFLPDWTQYGKAAGPIRNRQMAEYADAVVLLKGGRGTQSMYNEAINAELKVFDWRNNA